MPQKLIWFELILSLKAVAKGSMKYVCTLLFATMRTGAPRINAWFGSWRLVILTCTENSFYSAHIYNKSKWVHFCLKDKYSFLERQSLFHGGEYPILTGLLLEVNCSCAPCSSLTPPASASRQENIYLHTDNINKPDNSVRHSYCMSIYRLLNQSHVLWILFLTGLVVTINMLKSLQHT